MKLPKNLPIKAKLNDASQIFLSIGESTGNCVFANDVVKGSGLTESQARSLLKASLDESWVDNDGDLLSELYFESSSDCRRFIEALIKVQHEAFDMNEKAKKESLVADINGTF